MPQLGTEEYVRKERRKGTNAATGELGRGGAAAHSESTKKLVGKTHQR